MVRSFCLGLPRIGENGEMCNLVHGAAKNGFKDFSALQDVGARIRKANWEMLRDLGVDIIPCNDFSVYDHILDTTVLVGNIPRRYYWEGGAVPMDIYFSMIKGQQKEKFDVKGMSAQQWFGSRYFYVVPEFSDPIGFAYSDNKAVAHFLEAKKIGVTARPIMVGPVMYILMGKIIQEDQGEIKKADLVDEIAVVYEELFANFRRLKISDVYFDESFLIKDLTQEEQFLYKKCYGALKDFARDDINIHVGASYGKIGNNLECLMSLGAKSVHIDFTNDYNDVDEVLSVLPKDVALSMGLVDATNLYINDLSKSISLAERAKSKIGSDRLIISPSASLFLCPMDVERESFSPQNKQLCAFAKQKMQEVKIITDALNHGRKHVQKEIESNADLLQSLKKHVDGINKRVVEGDENVAKEGVQRSDFKTRNAKCLKKYKLPIMPMVDVGSMPTEGIIHNGSKLDQALREKITKVISMQEPFLDVVSSGELERVNNPEYFAGMLEGVEIAQGVIQTSGDSFMRAMMLFDIPVQKSDSSYVEIAKFSASASSKPLKFTIMGPISMANCFELPPGLHRAGVYNQMVSIVSQQVLKLETAKIGFITLDESFFLAHAPARNDLMVQYCRDASRILKSAYRFAKDETQISVYMKHLPFEDCVEYFQFDPDLFLIEASQSNFAVLEYFVSYKYPSNIGIGLFNPDSVRVATKPEIYQGIKKSLRVLDESQVWIVCDGGFKRRSTKDCKKSLCLISSVVKEVRKSV